MRLVRDPLVVFLLFGLVLFLAERLLGGNADDAAYQIEVWPSKIAVSGSSSNGTVPRFSVAKSEQAKSDQFAAAASVAATHSPSPRLSGQLPPS